MGVIFNPPAPLTAAVQTSSAAPVNVTLAGQLTVVVELAFAMVNVADAVLPSWFASAANVAVAVAVPGFMLSVYATANVSLSRPAPVTVAVQTACAAPV